MYVDASLESFFYIQVLNMGCRPDPGQKLWFLSGTDKAICFP